MLGIVIANWNGEKLIDKCLESLENQLFKDFKLYIIDNNSKDNSKEVIKKYSNILDIKLIEMDYNSGFALANNIGIKRAIKDGCNYILTLNNDVEIPKESLENAMRYIVNNREFDFFQLFMINYFNKDICKTAEINFKKNLITLQVIITYIHSDILKKGDIRIEGVCAGAAIYSVEALETVKLNDENYFDSNFFAYFEDVDLSLRLKLAGFRAKLLMDSVVYHMHSATGGKTTGFKEYYLTRNLFMYTKRNQTLNNYKKNKNQYYIRFLKTVIKNINDFNVIKSAVLGLKDGIKESKKIESYKG